MLLTTTTTTCMMMRTSSSCCLLGGLNYYPPAPTRINYSNKLPMISSYSFPLIHTNPPARVSSITMENKAAGGGCWRRKCVVIGVAAAAACFCTIIGTTTDEFLLANFAKEEGSSSSDHNRDDEIVFVMMTTSNSTNDEDHIHVSNSSSSLPAKIKWSEKRACLPWRGSNSLETVVPENLPRPSARRRYESIIRSTSKTTTAPPLSAAGPNCFSM